jgi:hypothetical protein
MALVDDAAIATLPVPLPAGLAVLAPATTAVNARLEGVFISPNEYVSFLQLLKPISIARKMKAIDLIFFIMINIF